MPDGDLVRLVEPVGQELRSGRPGPSPMSPIGLPHRWASDGGLDQVLPGGGSDDRPRRACPFSTYTATTSRPRMMPTATRR